MFFGWALLLSLSYLFIGAYRGDSVIIFQTVRRDQIVSLLVMLAALLALHLRARAQLPAPQSERGE